MQVLKRVTDEGSLPEIVQYGPSSRFECFTASKGSNNYFYLRAVNTLMRKGMGCGFDHYSLVSDPLDLATWSQRKLLTFCNNQQGSRYEDSYNLNGAKYIKHC